MKPLTPAFVLAGLPAAQPATAPDQPIIGTHSVTALAEEQPDGRRSCLLQFAGTAVGRLRAKPALYGYEAEFKFMNFMDKMSASLAVSINRLSQRNGSIV